LADTFDWIELCEVSCGKNRGWPMSGWLGNGGANRSWSVFDDRFFDGTFSRSDYLGVFGFMFSPFPLFLPFLPSQFFT
jgi:hypothetical protein